MKLDQAAKRIKDELPDASYPRLDPMLIALLIQVIVEMIKFCWKPTNLDLARRMKSLVGPFWWIRPANHQARARLRDAIDAKFKHRNCESHDREEIFQACLEALHGATELECLSVVNDARAATRNATDGHQ